MPVFPSASVSAPPPTPSPERQTPGEAPAVIRVRSDALFAGANEVQIDHDGVVYRLKRTLLGKLILTK